MNLTRRTLITGATAGLTLTILGGSTAAFAQNSEPTIAVGSKNYTEQLILGELVALLLEDAGFRVERHANLGGTAIVHEAIVAGDLDVYVEYTGSALTLLGQDVSDIREDDSTPEEVVDLVYDVVKQEYDEQFNVIWLDPVGFNNTYALAMRREHAEELGVHTISDLQEHAKNLILGCSQEFLVREDGLPGIEELYDIAFKESRGMESGLMYSALESGNVDVISAFSTDGRIPALDFALLDDDLGFFPPYYAAPIVRQDLLKDTPEVEAILNQLAGKITNDDMASMNYDVDEHNKEPIDAARRFLEQEKLIGSEG